MNPILLKPSTDTSAQVILLGKIWKQVTAWDYHTRWVEQLFPQVRDAYERLAADHGLILLEGGGSPAEINLQEHDIVNMRMAHAADAACVLVGDIDRGGVFASLVGTMELLEPEDRARFRGFIINKFRGDKSLLQPGVTMMERRLGLPCAGVVPHLSSLRLDEEDGVAFEERPSPARQWKDLARGPSRALRIGVIALPHIANFTDFDPLALEPAVSLAYLEQPSEVGAADLVILPGTKQTLDDLIWLEDRGFDRELRRLHATGIPIIGVCGGLQMLGLFIDDPEGIENQGTPFSRDGLGLLPIRTVLRSDKTVRRIEGWLAWQILGQTVASETRFQGYEIHVGECFYENGAQPLAEIVPHGTTKSLFDGAISESGRVFGTYVHGFFDEDDFRHSLINAARAAAGLDAATEFVHVTAEREARIDRLACQLRKSLDVSLIKSWLVAPAT